MTKRRIIHIDMDQFFAAVEQRDNPSLKGLPVAVAHNGPRSVVSTASYEARKFGVHSALPLATAKRLCPQLVIVEPHFHIYKKVSQQIHAIFEEYTDLIEPLSLDEAFLDVTENKRGFAMAVDCAREIKQRIVEATGLTASAGVSYCKFLAKIASDYRKPNGICVIHPTRAQQFIDQLHIERIWGVGQKTAEHFHRMGVFTGSDLRRLSQAHLEKEFGKMGIVFYNFARGIDDRPVVSQWERKSVSCEQTFMTDIYTPNFVQVELQRTAAELEQRIAKSQFEGHTLTLKVKFSDFQQMTRSITTANILLTKDDIMPHAMQLIQDVPYSQQHPIRLLGLGVSGHKERPSDGPYASWTQLDLPFQPWPDE